MFLKIIGLFGLFAFLAYFIESPIKDKIIGRLRLKLWPPKVKSFNDRMETKLPGEGEQVSVELALNSRCNSDYTKNQRYIHWGMFNKEGKLGEEQIKRIVFLSRIPRFTDKRVEITFEKNMLTFLIEEVPDGHLRNWVMVESGMQQQAVCLICAALGAGMVFRNLGMDGKSMGDNILGTVREELNPMLPSYGGSYWSDKPPSQLRPWRKGNLPDPSRDGNIPLLSVIKDLKKEKTGSRKATEKDISQLLWAARGRTPHLYKSKPWGMTIPFWTDKIEISNAYLIFNQSLYKYINWGNGRPTHSIEQIHNVPPEIIRALTEQFPQKRHFIIIACIDTHARAYWEVGYQLYNMLAQASALDVGYTASLLEEDVIGGLKRIGLDDPVAVLAV